MIYDVFKHIRKPEIVALLGSVLLSLIAIFGVVTIGKDAALYMDVSKNIDKQGLGVLFDRFNWPWISLLIAYTHKLTGLGYETSAYFYSVLFMSGVSFLIVLIVKRQAAGAAWWAVLIVLSVPVFNSFRYEIIRETGFWFFIVLAVWIMESSKPLSWARAIAFQLVVACAIFFRFEAVFMVLAGSLYCFLEYRKHGVRKSIVVQLKIGWIYLLALFALLVVFMSLDHDKTSRIQQQIMLMNPVLIYSSFMDTSEIFADTALRKWSYSDAPRMLLAGILFALIYRLVVYTGIVSALLFDRTSRRELISQLCDFRINLIAAALYFLILFVFFVQVKFVNSRYMTLLVLLLLPAIIVVASKFFAKHKKWRRLFIVVSVLVAISNVVSLGDKKTHYIEAAQWVRDNTSVNASIYYEDARIQYYAGRGYGAHHSGDVSLISGKDRRNYDYFIVENSKAADESYYNSLGFEVIISFSSKKKVIFVLKSLT